MAKLLKDGNLSGIAIAMAPVVGVALVFSVVYWLESYLGRLISFSIGLTLVAAAGYAGRAKAIGLRSLRGTEWH
ncbi:hypothetical protein K7G19_23085 [Cupriavidus sp. DB3]|uniref:hypothetical protein n=1 Tax=Cupriavidus sp. DB3 TaxID=2873259 RepID=UPI001CF5390F|nr:hypothetical protein [Cupriavidus sp. DB3]MCA7086484.1 hypothetical protein [Cupriavidus sp. DB3]